MYPYGCERSLQEVRLREGGGVSGLRCEVEQGIDGFASFARVRRLSSRRKEWSQEPSKGSCGVKFRRSLWLFIRLFPVPGQ